MLASMLWSCTAAPLECGPGTVEISRVCVADRRDAGPTFDTLSNHDSGPARDASKFFDAGVLDVHTARDVSAADAVRADVGGADVGGADVVQGDAASCGPCAAGARCEAGRCTPTCGVSAPTGSEEFVLRATQWRLYTTLYLQHFGADNSDGVIARMRIARGLGFNAVSLPAVWQELVPDAAAHARGGNFGPLDRVLDEARALGMKVRLIVWLRHNPDPSDSPDTPFYLARDCARGADDGTDDLPQWCTPSLASPRTPNAMAFLRATLAHVAPWRDDGTIAWYSVVHNATAEIGLSSGGISADYSAPARAAWAAWLASGRDNPSPFANIEALNAAWSSQYRGFDEVPIPTFTRFASGNDFEGPRGVALWRFREALVRRWLGQIRVAFDEAGAATWRHPPRILNDYGSVYDRLSHLRQSHAFLGQLAMLGPWGAGVKQNADNVLSVDEQRFAQELLVSQIAPRDGFTMNEAFADPPQSAPEWAARIRAWFDAGSNGVSFYLDLGNDAIRARTEAMIAELRAQGVWGAPVRCRNEAGTLRFRLSELLGSYFDGPLHGGPSLFDRFRTLSQGRNVGFEMTEDL